MRRYVWSVVLVALTVVLSVGVATANAAGGNSANAKLCQKGGWMNLQGSDGTQFANGGKCVSFGAHGGTIVPKPHCTAGSDNFADDPGGSQPTTFAGGTIAPGGTIRIAGVNFGGFPVFGTHVLYSGPGVSSDTLTFTEPVSSVQVLADSDITEDITLTAYDASNAVVGTPDTQPGAVAHTLSVSSTSNNIKSVILTTTPGFGIAFTDIVWSCA